MSINVKDKEHVISEVKNKDLRELDIIPHFKYNIVNWNKNCTESITDDSKYCFTCKQSICSSCSENGHDNHVLFTRKDYLFYKEDFFTPIENTFNEVLPTEEKKSKVKKTINDCFDSLIEKLNTIRKEKLAHVDRVFEEIDQNFKELRNNFEKVKRSISHYYKATEQFYQIAKTNIDNENTILLINFETMNLFDNNNREVFDAINKVYSQVNDYKNFIQEGTNKQLRDFDTFLDKTIKHDSYDNFYWHVIIRNKTYLDQINTFKNSIYETLQDPVGFDKLSELMDVFDSKNKKGIDFIYTQQFFNEGYDPNSSEMKTRGCQKIPNIFGSPPQCLTKRIYNKTGSNMSGSMTGRSSPVQISPSKISQYMTCLDSRVVQRLFAYSMLDTYNKCFNNANDRNTFNTNLLLENYKARENLLKETVKPILGTNEISIFNPQTNRIQKHTVKLEKEKHGYSLFPDGFRHIKVDGKLYITGGVDSIGNELNIVLCIDCRTFKIEKLDSLLIPHSYHTIEYLDNYDCLIVVGGDHNPSCELFDLFTRKWKKLPEMNYWRANVNIYYDNVTSDIYALFGMVGTIKESTKNNTDIIEVLELRDITSGWIRVDYYKNADFDLKINYCTVLPYTRDKLMIYGATKARVKKKCFALFDLKKNEIIKVNDNLVEDIRLDGLKRKEEEEKVKCDK